MLELTFGDDDDVADMVARACFERQDHELAWEELPGRAKKRCRETAKRCLNRQAVERMTVKLLDERDPEGEVRGWLEAIAEMVAGCRAAVEEIWAGEYHYRTRRWSSRYPRESWILFLMQFYLSSDICGSGGPSDEVG